MLSDGTEEQDLGQPGNQGARITEAEVKDAFSQIFGRIYLWKAASVDLV